MRGRLKRAVRKDEIQKMQERLQKIIARAGIASRRHAEHLILSGQVRVNGRVVTELGATMADPEGRKTLRNCLRGLAERVYPVGRLDYAASGLVFLTNDGDLAAEMLKNWAHLPQVYHVKIKGMLALADLERLGKEIGARMRTVRQPDATRRLRSDRSGRAANYWYEATLKDSKRDALRRVLFAEKHPGEKLKRIGLGPLTLEGLPAGRYRRLEEKEVVELRRTMKDKPKMERRTKEKRI